MKVIVIVGMPGSGKTEALNMIAEKGIHIFNMGDVVTKIEPRKRGIKKIDEYIENEIRMDIRKKLGKSAVAVVTAEEIEKMNSETVAIGGLHSFAEISYFKKRFGNDFHLIAIEASKETRFMRISRRGYRALDKKAFEHREQSYSKDFDIPAIMKKAEYSINNEGTLEDLKKNMEKTINKILKKKQDF
jgi:dephospho-CoA kinase